MSEGSISHDKVTRFLSSSEFTSKELWKKVKYKLRIIESETWVIIIDDTIEKKPYTDENEILCCHYDHRESRNVKGINIGIATNV